MDSLSAIASPFVLTLVIALIALIVVAIIVRSMFKRYIMVPPNRVAVFTGRGEAAVVRGRAKFQMPGQRVDYLELAPFKIDIDLKGAISKEGVPVDVTAVGMVRYGSSDDMIQAAIQRFLNADPHELHGQLNEILAANLRGIVATMTVEELNSDRDQLATRVIDEASTSLAKIGIEVDALAIQKIDDENGYLEALGRTKIAEVKRTAAIGEAVAERETRVQAAEATRASEIAESKSATSIAEAARDRDLLLAQYEAEVLAARAKAEQAGPLAKAEAEKEVGVAEEQAKAARTEAQLALQQQRTAVEQQRLQADVIAPAQAKQQAAVFEAQGARDASIFAAEAEAEATRRHGAAAADARKASAEADRVEGEVNAATLLAKLTAEADGQAKMAEALQQFTPEAIKLQLAPQLYQAMVDATAAAAAPLGNIDKVSVIGGGSDSSGGLMGGILGVTPQLIAQVISVLDANGVDVAGMLATSSHGSQPSAPATDSTVDQDGQPAKV